MEKGIIALAAALSVMTGMVTGIGEANVAVHAVDAIGKNPDAADKIRSMSIIGAAISETCAIYGMLVAFLIIFVLGA
jgi:F-type H+-transporting ATPase subunit c